MAGRRKQHTIRRDNTRISRAARTHRSKVRRDNASPLHEGSSTRPNKNGINLPDLASFTPSLPNLDLSGLSLPSLDLSSLNLPNLGPQLIGATTIVLLLVITIVCSAVSTPSEYVSTGQYSGTGGIKHTELFEKKSKLFYADLTFPRVFMPARPGKATVTGTLRDTGSAGDELSKATRDIESAGYQVGYLLLDLDTGITVSYNATTAFYSASSIKGPYVISLAANQLGDDITSESGRIEDIIYYSDNASYALLRDDYGDECFATLATDAKIGTLSSTLASEAMREMAESLSGASLTDNNYEYLTPTQLVALWQECYDYLTSGTEGAAWLGEILEEPEISAIRMAAGTLGTTWSKAGWYPEDGTECYNTTVDAGVINTSSGDFILCAMTNAPEDFAALESVVSPLMAVRTALVS